MKRCISCVALALLICMVGVSNNCIMKDKVIEIVLTDRTCADFTEYHTSVNFTNAAVVDYAEEVDAILADNDLSRDDIHSARVISASYKVTRFTPPVPYHDWTISGYIDVERLNSSEAPATVINYTSQSIEGAMGDFVIATLETPGVALLDEALTDYINWENPILEFEIHNSSVVPTPDEGDPIDFEWTACIVIYVTTVEEFEAPDPF